MGKERIEWPPTTNMPACLLIDAGNTEVKAMLVGQGFQPCVALRCSRAQWVDELGLETLLAAFFAQHPYVLHLALANVLGPEVGQRVQMWCVLHGIEFFSTSANNHPQLATAYTVPAQLGQDRWSAALAVAMRSQSVCNLVISLGTATTVDAVVWQSQQLCPWLHLGGYIVPGPGTMLKSLACGTAQLSEQVSGTSFQLSQVGAVLPTSTQQAIGAGVVAMQWQFIVGVAQSLSESQGGVPVHYWLLGGYANHVAFAPWLANPRLVHWPDAVFYGLYVAWQYHLECA